MGKIAYLCTRNQASTRRQPHCNRDVAQLVAHYVRDVGVGRSSRLIPTRKQSATHWVSNGVADCF